MTKEHMRCKASLIALLIAMSFCNTTLASTLSAYGSQTVEAAFSPDGQAQVLVEKVINSAHTSVRLAAYSFTSPTVVRCLIAAKRRGVDVMVVADEKASNSKSAQAALNLLVNADIPVRLNGRYAIHHDKYIVVDALHVQSGSFNYSKAAATSNSENVLVVWNNHVVADQYLRHWQKRFDDAVTYRSSY
jgi:phosphatidylserine/phosphatidylglycerophosphate/cardiolipin synthase-like enzyme